VIDGRPSGDSQAGRHLFQTIPKFGGQILAAGASDWVIFPGPQGYPQEDAYFLHFILHFIEQSLFGHPELNQNHFKQWIATRRRQVEDGELVYIAHQIDFAGRYAGPVTGSDR